MWSKLPLVISQNWLVLSIRRPIEQHPVNLDASELVAALLLRIVWQSCGVGTSAYCNFSEDNFKTFHDSLGDGESVY